MGPVCEYTVDRADMHAWSEPVVTKCGVGFTQLHA